jgi:iron complex outermembrane receptor protein
VVQYDYDVTFWQAAPYTQIEVTPWDRLKIDAGLRLDYVGFDYANPLGPLQTGSHRRPSSTAVSFQRLSPKIGANLEVAEGLFLFASYRAAFRAPSESQLFRQGSAVSTVDLKPVTADNYEAGVRAALGRRIDVEATAYQLDIANDILSFFNPTNGLRTSSNAGATRHRGVELGASVRPAASLRFDGSWAFTNQRYRTWKPNPTTDYSGNEIELAPRNMGRLGASWLPSLTGRGSLNVEWVHLGSYYMDPQNIEEYAGHDLFNVAATVPLGSAFEVVGRLQNVADTRFAETSSYTALQGRRLRPGPPRTFYLGAQYRFGRAEGGR